MMMNEMTIMTTNTQRMKIEYAALRLSALYLQKNPRMKVQMAMKLTHTEITVCWLQSLGKRFRRKPMHGLKC